MQSNLLDHGLDGFGVFLGILQGIWLQGQEAKSARKSVPRVGPVV